MRRWPGEEEHAKANELLVIQNDCNTVRIFIDD